jgi:NAD(P)-dependent dehydrogenase (short-subunit alcohol dehydrogenase family)
MARNRTCADDNVEFLNDAHGHAAVNYEVFPSYEIVFNQGDYELRDIIRFSLAKQGGGAIILLGSAAGLRGCLGALAYGVVKGALPQLARGLARELAEHNIRVNCVSPGVIRTPFQDFLTNGSPNSYLVAASIAAIAT